VDASADFDFETWYRQVHRRLLASMAVYAGSIEEAAEAVDEAFVRALERWDRVRVTQSPTAWVYRVAINVVKRRARRRALEATVLRRRRPPEPVPAPAGEAWLLVATLPDRQRLAVVLRHLGGLLEADIAAVMGVSRSTVSSTLAAAHHRLRSQLIPDATEVPNA
jgi:RNA polymerase sigma-70 factor (ECF subfamily)